jgi:4-diphosphocytidyl-2-C-methyl-D-erythritol kinase
MRTNQPITLKSPAKLNLFLKILKKREDHYHELQSTFQFIDLYDVLTFKFTKSTKKKEVVVSNPTINCKAQEDLIYKAAQSLLPDGYRVEIIVEKNIPEGGGLGGGSSNAALTLLTINHLLSLNNSQDNLINLGQSLGADIPFFLGQSNAFVEGIGEKITPLNIPEKHFLLIYPGVKVSTQEIFKEFKLTKETKPLKITGSRNDDNYKIPYNYNDLENVTLSKYPDIALQMNLLKELGQPRLTGTGSCFFIEMQKDVLNKLDLDALKLIKNAKSFKVKGLIKNPIYDHFL